MIRSVIGIDPGKTGAAAWLLDGKLASVENLPIKEGVVDPVEMTPKVDRVGTVVVIEKVHAMPREGVTSSFNFGKVYGSILYWAYDWFDHVELVTPQKWKKGLLVRADKEHSIEIADGLFGQREEWHRTGPRGGSMISENSGCAEASLIAWWGMKEFACGN